MYALEVNGTNYYSPPNVSFYGNNSLTSHDYYGGTFNETYGTFSSGAILNLGGTNDLYGADICIEMDTSMYKNYLYSISIILQNDNSYSYDIASGGNYGMLRGGYISSTAINNANSVSLSYFNVTKTNTIQNTLYTSGSILNYLVIPNANYNVICLPFKTIAVSNVIHNLLGFHINVIGNTSGLTQNQIDESINNSINNVYGAISSDLTSVESTLSTNINNTREEIVKEEQKTQDAVNNVNDSITSEEQPTKLDSLNDSAGWLPAGPVDSILNLPLTMFQNLSNNIGSTCTPLVINLPYVDKNINLPCLNSIYEQIDGLSTWINSIGVIASAFILYSYLLKLYKWVDDTLTFRENNHIDNWGGI